MNVKTKNVGYVDLWHVIVKSSQPSFHFVDEKTKRSIDCIK